MNAVLILRIATSLGAIGSRSLPLDGLRRKIRPRFVRGRIFYLASGSFRCESTFLSRGQNVSYGSKMAWLVLFFSSIANQRRASIPPDILGCRRLVAYPQFIAELHADHLMVAAAANGFASPHLFRHYLRLQHIATTCLLMIFQYFCGSWFHASNLPECLGGNHASEPRAG